MSGSAGPCADWMASRLRTVAGVTVRASMRMRWSRPTRSIWSAQHGPAHLGGAFVAAGRLSTACRIEVGRELPSRVRMADRPWCGELRPLRRSRGCPVGDHAFRSVISVAIRRSSMTARPCSAMSDASRGSQGLTASGPVSGVDSPAASASR